MVLPLLLLPIMLAVDAEPEHGHKLTNSSDLFLAFGFDDGMVLQRSVVTSMPQTGF